MRPLYIIAVLAMALVLPDKAEAKLHYRQIQVVCGTPAEIHALVPKEVVIERGILGQNDDGGLIEKWEDPATRAWSLIHAPAPNIYCILIGDYTALTVIDPKKEGQLL